MFLFCIAYSCSLLCYHIGRLCDLLTGFQNMNDLQQFYVQLCTEIQLRTRLDWECEYALPQLYRILSSIGNILFCTFLSHSIIFVYCLWHLFTCLTCCKLTLNQAAGAPGFVLSLRYHEVLPVVTSTNALSSTHSSTSVVGKQLLVREDKPDEGKIRFRRKDTVLSGQPCLL